MRADYRQTNIELLRLFAMFIIVAAHYGGHGVIQLLWEHPASIWGEGTLSHQIFTSLLIPGGKVGVGLFFVITGYFNAGKTTINANIRKIVEPVIFYGWCISLLSIVSMFTFYHFEEMSSFELFTNCIRLMFSPLNSNCWWFATSYCVLMLVSPSLNYFISKLVTGGGTSSG